MTAEQKKYYRRFAQFAIDCARLAGKLDWRVPGNKEWGSQLIKSGGSVGANYIEAVEGVSDADFVYRYGVCRKEANESVNWLFLLKLLNNNKFEEEFNRLVGEGLQYGRMFNKAIETKKKNMKRKENNK